MLYYPDSPMISFTLGGPPVGKERARTFFDPRVKRVISKTPAKTVKYEKSIATRALVELGMHNFHCESFQQEWPRDGRYALSVLPYFENKRRRDLDNVLKIVMDALKKVLWDDDTQVDEIYTRRSYDRMAPRVEVRAWVMP